MRQIVAHEAAMESKTEKHGIEAREIAFHAVDNAIASSNAQIDQLTTQVSTLTEERNDLVSRLTEVTALRLPGVHEEARRTAEVKTSATRDDLNKELLRNAERKCTLVMYYIIFVGVNTQSTHYSFLHPQFSWARRSTRNLGWSKS